MKIVPFYYVLAHPDRFPIKGVDRVRHIRKYGRAAMALIFGSKVLPVGTPDRVLMGKVTIYVFRGKVSHFHLDTKGIQHPVEWDPDGFAVAVGPYMGQCRTALKKLMERYPPVDPVTQQFQLRRMVREGD